MLLTRRFLITMIGALGIFLALHDVNAQPFPIADLEARDLPLRLNISKGHIQAGEKVELTWILNNNSSNVVTISMDRQDYWAGYNVEIFNAKGSMLTPTKDPMRNPSIGSRIDWFIPPLQTD